MAHGNNKGSQIVETSVANLKLAALAFAAAKEKCEAAFQAKKDTVLALAEVKARTEDLLRASLLYARDGVEQVPEEPIVEQRRSNSLVIKCCCKQVYVASAEKNNFKLEDGRRIPDCPRCGRTTNVEIPK